MATDRYRALFESPPYRGIRRRTVGAVSSPVLRLRRDGTDATRSRRPAPRPAWMLLYALLPLCAALFAFVDHVPSSGGLRTLAEEVVVVLVIGLAAVWVRANRRALSRMPGDSEAESRPSDITVEVHDPSPQVIHLEPRRRGSES